MHAAPPPAHAAPVLKLRPSLIPHAPTPQPSSSGPDDFETDELTRKVDMPIPRQAVRTAGAVEAVSASAGPRIAESVAPRVADAVASLAAKGPEYEAIANLSREMIEQVVWEVVPDLAEAIIKAELDRLVKERSRAS
jgi:hypothetical protein